MRGACGFSLRRELRRMLGLLALIAVILTAAAGSAAAAEGTEAPAEASAPAGAQAAPAPGAETQPSGRHEAQEALRQAREALRRAREAVRQAREAAREHRDAVRQARETVRHARDGVRQAREAMRLSLKEKAGNVVTIDCTGVTVAYHHFPSVSGSPNTGVEWISIKKPPESLSSGPIFFPPVTFSFEGSDGTSVVPIAFPVGHYGVDILSKWQTNGVDGNFDIHGNVTCSAAPAFTLHKLQAIAGSGQPPTEAPLTGQVGQTVEYAITATNTGNTPLTFGYLTDPNCDIGTVKGGTLTPIEPLGKDVYTCTHTLTAADRAAGSYANKAKITGTPEAGEGSPKTQESNTVLVTLAPLEEVHTEPTTPNNPPPPGNTTSSTTTQSGSLLSSSALTRTSPSTGVLGFTSATIPSLRGPQGCVRGAFTASIKSRGVNTAVFYLDGRKVKTLTARNSRKGLLSVHLDATRLRIGAHHVLARITMNKASASAKAAKAARSLTFVHCKSAAVTPHLAG